MYLRRIIGLATGYIAGIICATVFVTNQTVLQITFASIAILTFAYLGRIIYLEYKWIPVSLTKQILPIFLFAFSLGNLIANKDLHPSTKSASFYSSLKDADFIEVRGWIAAEPERRRQNRLDLRIRVSEVKKFGDKKWISLNSHDIFVNIRPPSKGKSGNIYDQLSHPQAYGYKIELSGAFVKSECASNPGGFDTKMFRLGEGYSGTVKIMDWRMPRWKQGHIKITEKTRGYRMIEYALATKVRFLRTFRRSIFSPVSKFISGATLGTRFALHGEEYKGKKIEDSFRHSGVGHVLAVSGLHVSVVALLLYTLFSLSGLNPKFFAPIVIILLCGFAFLTGARPSSLRATIMNSIIIITFVYAGAGFKGATFIGMSIASFAILFRRPMVLYSAGFLLSFGAVLSLVLLTNPVDRILRQLRGAVLVFCIMCYTTILIFACTNWGLFIRWESMFIIVSFFIFFINLGNMINRRFPILLRFRFDKIPDLLRTFLSAQFAIQIGMMIPMSAFFFGNFPIAGMFVNLLAIPMVGIIVQLGILTGLSGLIPYIGSYLAFLFGAANYFFGKSFIVIAHAGTEFFPYPPVPKPTVTWIIMYYLIVAFFLSGKTWFKYLQTLVFKNASKHKIIISRILPSLTLISLILFSIIRMTVYSRNTYTVDVLAESNIPVICITTDEHKDGAVIFNTGSGFFASRHIKNTLLARHKLKIDDALISAYDQDFSMAGLAELSGLLDIETIHFPAFSSKMKDLNYYEENPDKFYSAVGGKKMLKAGRKRSWWATKCFKGFCELRKSIKENCCDSDKVFSVFDAPGVLQLKNGVKINFLTSLYSTYPGVFSFTLGGEKWLIVADPYNRTIPKLSEKTLTCNVLVLGGPPKKRSKKRDKYNKYFLGLEELLSRISPERIILTTEEQQKDLLQKKAVEKAVELCKSSAQELFHRTDVSRVYTEEIKIK
ncbi:MAG: ComEC/Rec2 family competence protein [Verrucomicrobiota bacterium]|nr:ComEC/Rec2 family competence protein [Verrucomicrobiota bacterium]